MSASRLFAVLIVGCATFHIGCGSGGTSAPAASPSPAKRESPSDEECIAFAHKLEEALATGDLETAQALVDWTTMVDDALAGLDTNAKSSPYINGLREGTLRSSKKLFETISEQSMAGGSYRFLRLRTVPEGKRVLFRFLGSNEGGVNYQEILLVKTQNRCVGVDIYVHSAGETQTGMIRRMALLGAAEGTPTQFQELSGIEGEQARNVAASAEMFKAMKADRFADALAAYYRLPAELQREKPYLLARLRAAQKVSKDETLAALETFQKSHPNDPAADLHLIHYQMLNEDYAGARETLDRVEIAIGGDPYIDAWRAQFFLKEKDYANAEAAAKKALAKESSLPVAWWTRVTVALETHNYARTVELLKAIEDEIGQEPTNTELPLYADFLKSPENRKWKEEAKP